MKTALVTGASRGIGKAIATKLSNEGWEVIGTSTSGRGGSDRVNMLTLDLANAESIQNCVKSVMDNYNSIDLLVNNAGVLLDDEEIILNIDKLRKTLEVNLIGTADFTEEIIPLIPPGGQIVNISSTAGSIEHTGPNQHYPGHYPAYKISKAALNMYTRTLGLRLHDKEITVSSIHPGRVKTDMGGDEMDLSPEQSAQDIFDIIMKRKPSGEFWSREGRLPW
jgi:NAD(P)-dependent dehydrogenase (short-subunit alcohol dehydrogenase family)